MSSILQGNCGIELAQECENCEALGFGKAQIEGIISGLLLL
jgi:hypothetical protein